VVGVSRNGVSDGLALVRARSKALLGSTYRVEINAAIGSLGDQRWTRPMLSEVLEAHRIPESCVNKEISTLLSAGLLHRHERRATTGHYEYRRLGFPEFWDAMRLLALPDLPARRPGVVTSLHAAGTGYEPVETSRRA